MASAAETTPGSGCSGVAITSGDSSDDARAFLSSDSGAPSAPNSSLSSSEDSGVAGLKRAPEDAGGAGGTRRGLKRPRATGTEAEVRDFHEMYRRYARLVGSVRRKRAALEANGELMELVKLEDAYGSDGAEGEQSKKTGDGGGQKRRIARNYREQKRAHRISDVIEQLKKTLAAAGFPTRSTSKYHVLKAAQAYIQSLQHRERCAMMEKKVLEQLQGQKQGSVDRMTVADRDLLRRLREAEEATEAAKALPETVRSAHEGVALVRVDFRRVFFGSRIAMCLAAVDGRILRCNRMFELVMGYTSEEARQLTIFSLVPQECLQGTFEAAGRLLSAAQEECYLAECASSDAALSIGSTGGATGSTGSGSGASASRKPSTAASTRSTLQSGSGSSVGSRSSASNVANDALQRYGGRGPSRAFATFAKPKRGHIPYRDAGEYARHGRLYLGASHDRGMGKETKETLTLTTSLSSSAAPSMAALLGVHQLCASISVVTPSVADGSPKELQHSDASSSSSDSVLDPRAGSHSPNTSGDVSVQGVRRSIGSCKPRFFHVTIVDAPRRSAVIPPVPLTMKMFDLDDEED
uniref:BHLH domain-containing protein n=1 Tax=Pinguiococcus pyrenoidosus TaxID=172671 RepID=A0A7R9U164_9STRA|mmetsp:Transcript_10208/g.38684  ORF Transcript_10208/g.38684 Transcript_10208/m.38684 type:complete len:581 (+) Transcript_10208:222-1964(+)